ncbi:hypothetical protein DFP72DRAFT_349107 [Ephemerocybe angulata]|uniref:Uncharacterized protein n=1 Tax=Ephemerocybe angulata TaxID=980116 RepID=A0A8H6HYB5_9AGAR|nr:hypothetical protein DFP72DRAFT_349107 [Tulosesus angulatus]
MCRRAETDWRDILLRAERDSRSRFRASSDVFTSVFTLRKHEHRRSCFALHASYSSSIFRSGSQWGELISRIRSYERCSVHLIGCAIYPLICSLPLSPPYRTHIVTLHCEGKTTPPGDRSKAGCATDPARSPRGNSGGLLALVIVRGDDGCFEARLFDVTMSEVRRTPVSFVHSPRYDSSHPISFDIFVETFER